uniref:Guanine deaminase n=1 Tax=Denticeps clupeoides TaxID=299321 RepID=A0AAY4CY08_9TELE
YKRRTDTGTSLKSVFWGTFVHSTCNEAVQVLEDTAVGVDHEGKIVFIKTGEDVQRVSQEVGFNAADVKQLGKHEFFMPGMVDAHIHASQYSFTGTALDLPLLEWLNTYTFPVEAQFEDPEFAKKIYSQVVRRTLRNGTTTACYFATIYTETTLLLAEIADRVGQRALVGKVCMDRNDGASYYKESTEESMRETDKFITQLLGKGYPLVSPIITPRFAPSCTSPLLEFLGKTAKNNDIHVQSHISENRDEVNLVQQLFPDCKSYTDVYLKHGLLSRKTVMAHACYLSDKELEIFHKTGASIAHCPNSNISLCSGMLDVSRVMKHKVKIGLGTDVAGGYAPSMLDAIRRAIDTSKALTILDPKHQTLTFQEVFRLATLGGSQALSLDDQIGNFAVGKNFDALLVNVSVPDGPIDICNEEDPKVILEKFLNLGDDRNIVEVYVAGRRVVPFDNTS